MSEYPDKEEVEYEYEEYDGLFQLDKQELAKYTRMLNYYVDNQQDIDSKMVVVDNCITLEDALNKIKYAYTDETVEALKDVLKALKNAIPKVKETAMVDILNRNMSQILNYFKRIKVEQEPNYSQYIEPEYQYYKPDENVKQLSKQIAKQLTKSGSDWDLPEKTRRLLTNPILDQYTEQPDVNIESDKAIMRAIERLKYRFKEYHELSNRAELEELANEHNPDYQLHLRLRQIADLLLKSTKEKW